MYRPDGWKNVYDDPTPPLFSSLTINQERQCAFEAGADAMLEGLRKTSIAGGGHGASFDYWDNDLTIKGALLSEGYLVFIPEESNE